MKNKTVYQRNGKSVKVWKSLSAKLSSDKRWKTCVPRETYGSVKLSKYNYFHCHNEVFTVYKNFLINYCSNKNFGIFIANLRHSFVTLHETIKTKFISNLLV